MLSRRILSAALLSAAVVSAGCTTVTPGNESGLPNPYQRGEGVWGNLPEGRSWGAASAVQYAGNDTVWVADRCGGNRGPGSCEDRLDVDPMLLWQQKGTRAIRCTSFLQQVSAS